MHTITHTLAMSVLLLASAAGLLTAGELVLRTLGRQLVGRRRELYHRLLGLTVAGVTLAIVYIT